MNGELLARVERGETALTAVLGDITEQAVDAVVNAANERLEHGGGLAGAIVRRGGREIQEESRALAPVPTGGAVVTGAGRLPARWVVHAVGPVWGSGDEERKLRSAVRSALDRTVEAGARSVAMPAISTGIFGYPKREGVAAIVDEVVRWIDANPGTLTEIRFTAVDRETASRFIDALKTL